MSLMTRRRRIARLLDRFSRLCFHRAVPVDFDELDAYIDRIAD